MCGSWLATHPQAARLASLLAPLLITTLLSACSDPSPTTDAARTADAVDATVGPQRDAEPADADGLEPDAELAPDGATPPVLPGDPSLLAPPLTGGVFTPFAERVRFLAEGDTPTQRDLAPGALDGARTAVVRGRVRVRGGAGLPGVRVSILGQAALGHTLTRATGEFELLVHGGGFVTLDYALAGHTPAQRRFVVRPHEFARAPEVALVPLDSAVTTVELGGLTRHALAAASPVTDELGTRRASLVFAPGTRATMTAADGTTQPLPTVSVRATEYTVGPDGPAAMPGELPVTSGYTYAVELSVDEALAAGARRVDFSTPVAFYVDDVLGFPVGEPVPLGAYDRDRAAWVAHDDGRVVALVSITGGLAQLDLDGDGAADSDLAHEALGITPGEREALARDRQPGARLWRASIPHFTPWDCNWPFGPPEDAEWPDVAEVTPPPDPCERTGSILECQSRAVRQRHAVDGTPLVLEHSSQRSPAGRAPLTLRLSGRSVPRSLQRVHAEVTIAGQTVARSYAAGARLADTFAWDGRDAYGRSVGGLARAQVRVGYEYVGAYRRPATSIRAFGQSPTGTTLVDGSLSRRTLTLWRSFDTLAAADDPRAEGLGGWTVAGLDRYDPELGAVRTHRARVERVTSRVDALAGTGSQDFFDRTPESETGPNMSRASGLAVASDGAVFVLESGDDRNGNLAARIRRRAPDGTWSLLAGTFGPESLHTEGVDGPAVDARLTWLAGPLAVGPDDTLYFADDDGIFHIDRAGILRRLGGRPGPDPFEPTPEGVPALDVYIRDVLLLEVGRDGTVYYVRGGNSNTYPVLNAIMPDGRIQRLAGSVTVPLGVEEPATGARARDVRFAHLTSLVLGADDTVYLGGSRRMWRLERDGRLTTIALADRSGDGRGDASLLDRYAGASALVLPYLFFQSAERAPDGSIVVMLDAATGPRPRRWARLSPDGRVSFLGDVPAGASGFSAGRYAGFGILPSGALVWRHNPGTRGDFLYTQRVGDAVGPGCAYSVPSTDTGWSRCFDATGRLVALDAPQTGTRHYTFGYDTRGRLAQVTDVDGQTSRVERDARDEVSALVGPFGHRTRVEVDSRGWLSALVAPDNARTTYETDDRGLITAKVDAKNQRSSYTYPSGLLHEATDREGHTQRFEATGTASVTVTTAEGVAYTYGFEGTTPDHVAGVITPALGMSGVSVPRQRYTRTGDTQAERRFADGTVAVLTAAPDPVHGLARPVLGRLEVTRPRGTRSVTTGARTITGDVTTDTLTVNGRTYTSTWNAATRTLVSTTPEGRTVSLVLDARDRVVDLLAPGFDTHHFDYDATGRVRGMVVGSDSATFDYDARSHLRTVTRFDGQTTTFDTDARGRATAEYTAGTATIGFGFDPNGNLSSLTPPATPAHGFGHDANDRVVRVDLPDVGEPPMSAVLQRDRDGRPHILTRPDGTTVTSVYDPRGRLRERFAGADWRHLDYDDATHELTSVGASSGVAIGYAYDGPVVRELAVTGPVSGRIVYTHDADGFVDSRTVAGRLTRYTYDRDKLLTGAGPVTLTYDPRLGLPTGHSVGTLATSLDARSDGDVFAMTTSVAGARLHRVEVIRDTAGRLLEERETLLGQTTVWTYGRTPDGFLERITRDGRLEEEAGYDDQGNRTSHTVLGRVVTATFDAQDRLGTHGDWTVDYRRNGQVAARTNTASGEVWVHHHDDLGELTAVTLPDGRVVSYLVDGLGRRTARAVDGVYTHRWLYGPSKAGGPIAEVDARGQLLSEFIYGGPLHAPLVLRRGAQTYRYVTDLRGSVRAVVDVDNGAVVQRLDYDRWGRVTLDTNPGFQPFGFAAGLWDADTRLVRFGARDYDPTLNRWMSRDPLGFAAGDSALYAYGFGDPVSFVDPSGEICFIPVLILAIKIADVAMNAYDTYQTAKKLADPCVDSDEKAAELALLAAQWIGGKLVGKVLNKVAKSKFVAKFGCFAAGTLVLTATAASAATLPVPIEAVSPGAIVRAYDSTTRTLEDRRVEAVHVRHGVPTLELGLESESIGSTTLVTTAEHPLWSWQAGGYVRADHLERDDWLWSHDGTWARVASARYTGRTETVYNLTVEDAESYFVGEAGVLAHNLPTCNGHHSFPKFMGGDANQPLSTIDVDVHKELHSRLQQAMREAGLPNVGGVGGSKDDWADLFTHNPGSQSAAIDILLDVTRTIDAKHGTSITQDLWSNLIHGNFQLYP